MFLILWKNSITALNSMLHCLFKSLFEASIVAVGTGRSWTLAGHATRPLETLLTPPEHGSFGPEWERNSP